MSLTEKNLYFNYENRKSSEINSIFKYYSVRNEVNFVLRQLKQGTNLESAKRYINNSIHRFLGEFVGKVSIDKVDYQMTGGRIMFDGVAKPVGDSYKERGETKGINSREYAEAVGFEKIERKFATGEANIAFWLSPPSFGEEGFGNYGFLFTLVKDEGGQIDEYILRYKNENEELEKSNEEYNRLLSFYPLVKPDENPIKNTGVNSFLQDPLFAKVENKQEFLVELGYRNLSKFRDFQQKLDQEILFREWLDEYIQMIFEASQEENVGKRDILIDQTEKTLAGIYNLTQDIKDNCLEIQKNKTTKYPDYSYYQMASTMRQNYIQKEAVVIGGGSCPADTNSTESLFQTGWKLIFSKNGILDYQSASKLTSDNENADTFPCPSCGQPIPKGKGITTCPHCGITKEEYIKLTEQKKYD